MIKKALLALAITGTMATAQANIAVSESFAPDTSATPVSLTTRLTNAGWIINNQSTPAGVTSWFQGDPSSSGLTSHLGTIDNAYISANYQNAADGGILNDYLETPIFSTSGGVIVTFFINAAVDPTGTYFDQFDFGFINATTGIFTSAVGNILTAAAGQWTQYTVTLAATPGSARFAIDYTGSQLNANVIALDDLTVTVPEPGSIAILAAGLMGLTAARRRKSKQG